MEIKELQAMADRWPSTVVARSKVKSFTGGAVSGKTLANADSAGTGPEGRFKIGRSTVYPVFSLISWLEERTKRVCTNRKIDQRPEIRGGQNAK